MRKLKLNVAREEMDRAKVARKWSGTSGVSLAYGKGCEDIAKEKDLIEVIQQHTIGSVCEVGCGPGRMAKFFNAAGYIGVDINPAAIEVAIEKNPLHAFKRIKWDDEYPEADTYFFFTVLLHIPDDEVYSILDKVKGRIIIGECLFRGIREFANGMNFQRDPGDYKKIIEDQGGKLLAGYHIEYSHFPYFINILVAEK